MALDAQGESALDRAKSKYTLVEPLAGSENLWNAYTVERHAVAQKYGTVLLGKKKYDGSEKADSEMDDLEEGSKNNDINSKEDNDDDSEVDNSEYDEMGDKALVCAILNAVGGLEEELDLPKNSLLSGTSVLYDDSLFEEEDQPRTVTLLTRMYSVSSLSSVDIHLTYHSRSRSESIEWYIGIGYKINSRPNSDKPPNSADILGEIGTRDCNFSVMYMNGFGWHTFYTAFFDDEMGFQSNRWKKYEVKDMGLHEEGLRTVHDALLGAHPCMDDDIPQTPENDALKRERLVQTARLLLAGVGITCFIATEDSEEDKLPGGWNGGIKWLLEGIPSWFAREVRSAAGFQLKRDAAEAKKHAQMVEDEMRGWYDEDEDEDEDKDEDEDDEDEDEDEDDEDVMRFTRTFMRVCSIIDGGEE